MGHDFCHDFNCLEGIRHIQLLFTEETDQGLQTEEDLLQTEGENEIIMMTDEEIQGNIHTK